MSNFRGRKIFDALTKFDGELVSALFTTYNFDAVYFENTLLPALLSVVNDDEENPQSAAVNLLDKMSHTKICVIADGRINNKVTKSLYGYDYIPIFTSLQHSKLSILQFEEGFRLIVGSANITRSGIHTNREVYVEFEFDKTSTNWKLFFDAIDYLSKLSSSNSGRFDPLIEQFRTKATQLKKLPDSDEGVRFIGIEPGGSKMSLRSTLDFFLKRNKITEVGNQRVDDIYLLSAFFEDETAGEGLKSLLFKEYMALKADHPRYPNVHIYMPTNSGNILTLFPQKTYTAVAETLSDKLTVYENSQLVTEGKFQISRFPHGKMYIVSNSDAYTLIILGSSNFSPSGFGQRAGGKGNWEANIAYFSESHSQRAVQALLPGKKEIPQENWQACELPIDLSNPENPANNDEIIIYVTSAIVKDKILQIIKTDKAAQDFKYSIGGVKITFEWVGDKGRAVLSDLHGLSIEVRDKSGILLQELPIYFTDASLQPEAIQVSKEQLIDWIEQRYLFKKNRPLSMLLAAKKGTKGTKVDKSNFDTDDYVMYRVKKFNSLVSKIFERLSEISDYPKRIDYHLLGQFGLIHCIADYVENANNSEEFSVFYYYQAVEVVTSILAALEITALNETKVIIAKFTDQAMSILDTYKPQANVKKQTDHYIAKLKSFSKFETQKAGS